MVRVGIVGDFAAGNETHRATDAALRHAGDRLEVDVAATWLSTEQVDERSLRECAGVLIAPGSPYRDMQRVLAAIRFARERGVPCLGTCGGFQHMVIEYARAVLGVRDAQHAECDASASELFITKLACSLRGRSMELQLVPGSQVAACYARSAVVEQYYCSFGVDPARVSQLQSGPLRVTGSDAEGEVRIVELPGHPFFIGTLFVPQARSLPEDPHPLVVAFVRAAMVARG